MIALKLNKMMKSVDLNIRRYEENLISCWNKPRLDYIINEIELENNFVNIFQSVSYFKHSEN